jgi:hypothetical protein
MHHSVTLIANDGISLLKNIRYTIEYNTSMQITNSINVVKPSVAIASDSDVPPLKIKYNTLSIMFTNKSVNSTVNQWDTVTGCKSSSLTETLETLFT